MPERRVPVCRMSLSLASGTHMAAAKITKRLPPGERKVQILNATLRLLATNGLQGFSLEAAAREAGVAASLPRHYFGGTSGLLKAATEDVLEQVQQILWHPPPNERLEVRLARYLDILAEHPWGHDVWMRAAEIHEDVAAIVRHSRRRMVETIFGRDWRTLSHREQIDGRGHIGHIETIVSDWIERGMSDSATVVDVLARAVRESYLASTRLPQGHG